MKSSKIGLQAIGPCVPLLNIQNTGRGGFRGNVKTQGVQLRHAGLKDI